MTMIVAMYALVFILMLGRVLADDSAVSSLEVGATDEEFDEQVFKDLSESERLLMNEVYEGFDSWDAARRRLFCDDAEENDSDTADEVLTSSELDNLEAPNFDVENPDTSGDRKLSISERLAQVEGRVTGALSSGDKKRRLTHISRRLCCRRYGGSPSCRQGQYLRGYCRWGRSYRMGSCYNCGGGSTSSGGWVTGCSACAAGKWGSSSPCYNCGPGKANPHAGQASCRK